MLTQIGNPVTIAITIRTELDIPPESDLIGASKVVVWIKKERVTNQNIYTVKMWMFTIIDVNIQYFVVSKECNNCVNNFSANDFAKI